VTWEVEIHSKPCKIYGYFWIFVRPVCSMSLLLAMTPILAINVKTLGAL